MTLTPKRAEHQHQPMMRGKHHLLHHHDLLHHLHHDHRHLDHHHEYQADLLVDLLHLCQSDRNNRKLAPRVVLITMLLIDKY